MSGHPHRPGETPLTPRPTDGGRNLVRGWPLKPVSGRGLLLSRGAVLIPVAALLMSAVAAFAGGTALFVWSLLNVIRHPLQVGRNAGHFLLIADVFVVGLMMLAAAIGLYELFIRPLNASSPRARVPRWPTMTGLNDLAARLVPMLVLIAVISFAAVTAGAGGGHDVLLWGGGLALVIAALMVFLRFGTGGPGNS